MFIDRFAPFAHPTTEWRKIAGLIDIIAHTYFTVNAQIVWNIITTKIDLFYEIIKLILDK